MRHPYIVALALALTASAAEAQFTTVVAPPRRNDPVAETPAEVAARDTGHRATLRDMSAWVDSVAGIPAAVEPGVVTDSASGSVAAPTEAAAQPGVTRFEDGVRAPDTASALPALLGGGMILTALGTILLFTTRRRDA